MLVVAQCSYTSLCQPLPLPKPSPDHLVFKYGKIEKGRNLVLRALMLMAPDQVYRLLHVVMARLYLFACPDNVR